MTDEPEDPPAAAPKPKPSSLRHKPGGLAAANLGGKGGAGVRNDRAAQARSASKSKPWMSR